MSSSPRSGGDPGHHGHAGMAEEGASELKLPRSGGGLSYTVGQHQSLVPVTSSDPPPMSSTPRSGGDADEEKGWSKRLKKDCVSEIVSDQEQSNPLFVAGVGHPVHASMGVRFGHGSTLWSWEYALVGPSHTVRPRPRPPLIRWEVKSSSLLTPPLGCLNTARGTLDLPRPDDWRSSDRKYEEGDDKRSLVPSDEEQSDPSDSGGEVSSSDIETIGSRIVEIVDQMEDKILRESKKVEAQKEMIYRFPEITRRLDQDAYDPQFVSFSPYHRGTRALRSANKYKWFFLKQILNMNKDVPLRQYLEEMDGVKQRVNGCYEKGIPKYGLIKLLLDGCCILGFLGILPLPPQEVDTYTQKQDKVVAEASTVRKFISRVKKMLAPHPKQEVGIFSLPPPPQEVGAQAQKQDKLVVEASTLENEMLACTVDFVAASPLPSSILPQREVGAQTRQEQDKVVAEASEHSSEIHNKAYKRKWSTEDAIDLAESSSSVVVEGEEIRIAVEAESKRTADSARIPLWHHDSIRHDLLLMENQLPFFVLQKIYGLATAGTPDELKGKVDQTIQKLLAFYPLKTTEKSFHHLLHCCHLKFRPTNANSSSSNSKPTGELQPWRGATDLDKAGIKFKPKLHDHDHSLLDVELVSGKTLMIPTLIIEDSTSSVFRNLIAFEQSCTDEKYFTAYAFFMKELMRTPADVTLLVKKGVIENYLGLDKEVSDFFNNLVKRVAFDVHGEHFLSSTLEELKSSYNSVGKKHIADLKQNYCRSPWLVISVIAATIVLVCTVVQTVVAVIK